jgi:hypothetical protein
VLKTLLHSADLANPAKPWPICRKWSDGVIHEFFLQVRQPQLQPQLQPQFSSSTLVFASGPTASSTSSSSRYVKINHFKINFNLNFNPNFQVNISFRKWSDGVIHEFFLQVREN